MKKSLKNVVCLLALVAITAPSFGAITGSAHDFSSAGSGSWTSGSEEKCDVCHAPHGNQDTLAAGASVLWNHEVSTKDFSATLYDSPTMDATTGVPSGASKLCLSCHDGTVELDSFGGATGATTIGAGFQVGAGAEGLSQEHPISFSYSEAYTGEGAGTTLAVESKTTAIGGTITQDLLVGGNVECASCHDVHNSQDNGAGLLQIVNTNSELCLTCHEK